jgi:hypothetical protein
LECFFGSFLIPYLQQRVEQLPQNVQQAVMPFAKHQEATVLKPNALWALVAWPHPHHLLQQIP